MRTYARIAAIAVFCIFLCGCGPDSDHITIQEQEHIRTQDVVDALHLDIHRFHISPGFEGDVWMKLWVEEYIKKDGDVVHIKHDYTSEYPLSITDGKMLFLFPTERRRRYYFEVPGSGAYRNLPDDIRLDYGSGHSSVVPDDIQIELGKPFIIGMHIYGKEMWCSPDNPLEEIVTYNLENNDVDAIIVFKVEFSRHSAADKAKR